jgi:ribosome-associated toxin RatA of RatAB toxin-antitoxin module
MNTRIQELAEQAGLKYYNWSTNESNIIDGDFKYPRLEDYEKFAELIVRECARLNLELSYELAGVIIDTEEGIGFDSVCLNTVKQVHNSLASNQLTEHFGVEL